MSNHRNEEITAPNDSYHITILRESSAVDINTSTQTGRDKSENNDGNNNDDKDNNNNDVIDCDDDDDDDDDEVDEEIVKTPKKKKRTRHVYNGMIECNVEPIRSLLTCTLCEGLYREPYTTLKCFHTFCKSCLITAIRASYNMPHYNSCPICETYFGRDDIVTNNALPDRVLETLIDKVLFPHLAHHDYLLECEFYNRRNIQRKENLSRTTASTATSIRSTTGSNHKTAPTTIPGTNSCSKDQATTVLVAENTMASSGAVVEMPKTRTNKNTNTMPPHVGKNNSKRPAPRSIVLDDDKDKIISFRLIPSCATKVKANPGRQPPVVTVVPSLKLPFFKTSAHIRIEQIKKLLIIKLFPHHTNHHHHPQQHEFVMYCNGCLLEDELSLNFISHVIWDANTNNNNHDKDDPNNHNEKNGPTLTLEYQYITK